MEAAEHSTTLEPEVVPVENVSGGEEERDEVSEALAKYNQEFDFTGMVRRKITDKVMRTVDTLEFNPEVDGATKTDAKRQIIETALGAVNDIDKQHRENVKLKAKLAQEEREAEKTDISSAIITLLSSISPRGEARNPEDQAQVDQIVNNQLEEVPLEKDVSEGETIIEDSGVDVEGFNNGKEIVNNVKKDEEKE